MPQIPRLLRVSGSCLYNTNNWTSKGCCTGLGVKFSGRVLFQCIRGGPRFNPQCCQGAAERRRKPRAIGPREMFKLCLFLSVTINKCRTTAGSEPAFSFFSLCVPNACCADGSWENYRRKYGGLLSVSGNQKVSERYHHPMVPQGQKGLKGHVEQTGSTSALTRGQLTNTAHFT